MRIQLLYALKKAMSRRYARETLLALMYEYAVNDEQGHETLDVMGDVLAGPLTEQDKDYINTCLEQFIENSESVDAAIAASLKSWNISRLAKLDLAILRLAVVEMTYQENIPAKVSINEAVELAKKFSSDQAPKFINGVLAGCLNKLESSKLA